MNFEKILASIILSAGIFLGGFFIAGSLHYIKDFDRTVKVKGLDEKNVKSDLGILTLTFVQSSDGINEIYKSYSLSQNRIMDFLHSKGVKNEEVEKTGLEVQDNRQYSENLKKPAYTGTSKIIISSKEVDLIKSLSQNSGSLLEKGVVITQADVKFLFTSLNSIKNEMLDRAVKNAYEAANTFTSQTNSKLGKIRNASQGLFTIVDANSTEDYEKTRSIQKRVRVVVAVDYFLE